MRKIKILTQVIRDYSKPNLGIDTLETLKMIDDESTKIENLNSAMLSVLIEIRCHGDLIDFGSEFTEELDELIEKAKTK